MDLDVAIIGAGVVGCAIARELSRYKLTVGVFEREVDISFGTTKANSGIVHAGFHSPAGTLKASLCVRGCQMYPALAQELEVLYRQNGALMVAQNAEELPALEAFVLQGKENGLNDLSLLDRTRLLALEPNLSPELAGALWAPSGGIVVPFDLAIALADNARANGVRFFLGAAVEAVELLAAGLGLQAGKARHRARFIVNCAGLGAAAAAGLISDDSFAIKARKGQEYLLDRRLEGLVRHTIYPLPSKVSKGILVIPTVDGNIMIGPTAEEAEGCADLSTNTAGWREIYAFVRRLVPSISARDLITSFVGLRAVGPTDDFIIVSLAGGSPLAQCGRNRVARLDGGPRYRGARSGDPGRARPRHGKQSLLQSGTPGGAVSSPVSRGKGPPDQEEPFLRPDRLPLRAGYRSGDRRGHQVGRHDDGRYQVQDPGRHGPLPGRVLHAARHPDSGSGTWGRPGRDHEARPGQQYAGGPDQKTGGRPPGT